LVLSQINKKLKNPLLINEEESALARVVNSLNFLTTPSLRDTPPLGERRG
jgi:hypothetical protein